MKYPQCEISTMVREGGVSEQARAGEGGGGGGREYGVGYIRYVISFGFQPAKGVSMTTCRDKLALTDETATACYL